MKRVRIAPGKFVTISTELAEKAARVFATGLTRDQVRDLKASEPRGATGVIVGSSKPLVMARARDLAGARPKPVVVSKPACEVTTSMTSAPDSPHRTNDRKTEMT